MTNESLFAKFGATSSETYKENKPEDRAYTDRYNYLTQNVRLAKPPENVMSRYRLIPWPEKGYFAEQARLHFQLGLEKHATACYAMLGQPCPACQQNRALLTAGHKEAAALYMPKTYHLCWVIDRAQPELDPQIWAIPDTTIQTIRGAMKDMETNAIRSIDSIFDGHDIMFVKRKKTPTDRFQTINDIQLSHNPSPLGTEAQMIHWLQYVQDRPFKEIMSYMPLDKLKAIIEGRDISDVPAAEEGAGETTTYAAPPAQQAPPTLEEVVAGTSVTPSAPVAQPAAPAAVVPPAPATAAPALDIEQLREQLKARTKKS